MQSTHFPIGIFDSGVGGTSVWKEISALLPLENTLYLSDSKNAPYGQKSKKEIIDLATKNTEFLLAQNCKLIVIACNTASTNAIEFLRETYDVPFVGIEPAITPASLKTKTNHIGVLATKATLNSTLFKETSGTINKEIYIKKTIGEGLAELIEEGKLHSEKVTELLKTYIQPMIDENVDCLVLGCTHYPYLTPQIKKIVGNKIKIIDSGKIVARETRKVLESNILLNKDAKIGNHQFYINKDKSVLEALLSEYSKTIKITERLF